MDIVDQIIEAATTDNNLFKRCVLCGGSGLSGGGDCVACVGRGEVADEDQYRRRTRARVMRILRRVAEGAGTEEE